MWELRDKGTEMPAETQNLSCHIDVGNGNYKFPHMRKSLTLMVSTKCFGVPEQNTFPANWQTYSIYPYLLNRK